MDEANHLVYEIKREQAEYEKHLQLLSNGAITSEVEVGTVDEYLQNVNSSMNVMAQRVDELTEVTLEKL